MRIKIAWPLMALFISACTSGPCRSVKHPELMPPTPDSSASSPGSSSGDSKAATKPTPSKAEVVTLPKIVDPIDQSSSVFVYKPDGSLQCGQGKAVGLSEMEKQLKGIKIISRENKGDGLMHIQVCGSPTGMINVFEIPREKLAAAEKRGFKKLEVR